MHTDLQVHIPSPDRGNKQEPTPCSQSDINQGQKKETVFILIIYIHDSLIAVPSPHISFLTVKVIHAQKATSDSQTECFSTANVEKLTVFSKVTPVLSHLVWLGKDMNNCMEWGKGITISHRCAFLFFRSFRLSMGANWRSCSDNGLHSCFLSVSESIRQLKPTMEHDSQVQIVPINTTGPSIKYIWFFLQARPP